MSLALAMVFTGWIRHCRREPEACREQADAVIAFATEHEIPFWTPNGLTLRGWALVEHGELEQGVADLEQGLALWTPIGANIGRTPDMANLAVAKARAESARLGRCYQCKALIITTGERYHEPEIHRLDAELVLTEAGGAGGTSSHAREQAETLLHTAIECAGAREARTLELRAATTLARLRGRGAKGSQARARLADLLASFTEGFDTADLQDARRLVAR